MIIFYYLKFQGGMNDGKIEPFPKKVKLNFIYKIIFCINKNLYKY